MIHPSGYSARIFFPILLVIFFCCAGKILAGSFSEFPATSLTENEATSASEGVVLFTIDTIREQTPRMRSILAKRVEIWIAETFIASLSDGEPGVTNSFHHRRFSFPAVKLQTGYHFITIKAYAEGFISRETKWKGRTIQIGVHPGRTTIIEKTFPFFVW